MNFFKTYSLNHCRSLLQSSYHRILNKKDSLTEREKDTARLLLKKLQDAINVNDRTEGTKIAKELEAYCQTHVKKSPVRTFLDLIFALLFALIIATIIRQTWFEPYEIPTGSMRPTFKEQDHLTVSKTQFGINIPLVTDHFYFDPNQVQRGSTVIFTGDKLPVIDSSTNYFGILPYTKRYVKRLMGKPGDTVYFYGGKLYGLDKEGRPIEELLNASWLTGLEHIPFLSFMGMANVPKRNEVIFSQAQQPIARLELTYNGAKGEIFDGQKWITDDFNAAKTPHKDLKTLSDFWGIGNYAMSELATKEDLAAMGLKTPNLEDADLYLVLRHHPTMDPKMLKDYKGPIMGTFPILETSIIPLNKQHLDALMDHMYTARFVIKNGKAKRYSVEEAPFTQNSPTFSHIPDGTYEFYYGKAYKILFGGIAKELPIDHPIYRRNLDDVKKLYNYGINMDLTYGSSRDHAHQIPNRYAYFREGDLYLLGGPVIKKDDPSLMAFNKKEEEKEVQSTAQNPYAAFKDHGAPLANGRMNVDFIKTFGLKIPENNYLVLGDNHAMSADSRVFGFVPQQNLQGVPDLILWPRLTYPMQNPYTLFVFSRLSIWILAAAIGMICYAIYRYRLRRPIDISKI